MKSFKFPDLARPTVQKVSKREPSVGRMKQYIVYIEYRGKQQPVRFSVTCRECFQRKILKEQGFTRCYLYDPCFPEHVSIADEETSFSFDIFSIYELGLEDPSSFIESHFGEAARSHFEHYRANEDVDRVTEHGCDQCDMDCY